jgi:hypothetical protein
LSSTGHEDIRGLDVTMNDALAVSSIESIRDLDAEIENRFGLQRLAFYELPEGLSLEQFHSNEGFALDLIDFVYGANIRMVQGRSSTRLTAKTLQCLRVVGEFFGKKLLGLRGDRVSDLQIRRRRPSHRRQSCGVCGSGRRSGRRVGMGWPSAGMLGRKCGNVNRLEIWLLQLCVLQLGLLQVGMSASTIKEIFPNYWGSPTRRNRSE